ncbi:MAG: hypothetical protein V2J62_05195 [candidate division KSB1 bacterium]|jgi:glutathione synthase/RimK-type ligase-like ATP-grasp enzyme|nr:hypothetical protein [candidate division KSB1 bacterium]
MNDKSIVILTGNRNFFGQTRKPWVSMDVDLIEAALRDHGYPVQQHTFSDVINRAIPVQDAIIFYTFSQKRNRREYLRDAIYFLNSGTNILIPSMELLHCHENKGFQELYKRQIGVHSLSAYYFSSVSEISEYDIKYPVVFKTVTGSNAKGVFLAHSEKELLKIISRVSPRQYATSLDLLRRKYFRKKKSYKEYPDYNNRTDFHQYKDYILKEVNFILQEFVPDLNFDYRVLTLFDRYFVVRRATKEDDFRASGAKRFSIVENADERLLNYAKQIYGKFDTPFLSMDICQKGDDFYMLEFQALHFGVNVLVKNSGYYVQENSHWRFQPLDRISIEDEISRALIGYIRAMQ